MNLQRTRNAVFLSLALLLTTGKAITTESAIEGVWLSGDGDGWIELRREGDTLSGFIAGSPNDAPGEPSRLDVNNPDPKLRARALLGIRFMQGFRYKGDDKWTGGTIYDPNSGKTYKGNITQIDTDTLKLRGYIGVSLFGRNEIWTRK
jgi:uncharacterized protein (DUF2147 family)